MMSPFVHHVLQCFKHLWGLRPGLSTMILAVPPEASSNHMRIRAPWIWIFAAVGRYLGHIGGLCWCMFQKFHILSMSNLPRTRSYILAAEVRELCLLVESLSGWWFHPLWQIFVSWDHSSQYMGKKKCSKMFQNVPNHQPAIKITLKSQQESHWSSIKSQAPSHQSFHRRHGHGLCRADQLYRGVCGHPVVDHVVRGGGTGRWRMVMGRATWWQGRTSGSWWEYGNVWWFLKSWQIPKWPWTMGFNT